MAAEQAVEADRVAEAGGQVAVARAGAAVQEGVVAELAAQEEAVAERGAELAAPEVLEAAAVAAGVTIQVRIIAARPSASRARSCHSSHLPLRRIR